MKNLEQFIRSRRQELDHREVPTDAWDTIRQSLPANGRGQTQLVIWRIAAAVFFVSTVFLLVTRNGTPRQEALAVREFTDVESYYSNQISEKIDLIRNFEGADQQEEFTEDLQKLEAMYDVLLEEMKRQPTQKVKDALILNLLVRIDLLNQQINRLERDRTAAARKDTEI